MPETALDLIDSVGERRALITRAGHDTQGVAHFRLGKPAGALEVDSPDDVRLAFAHHDPHDGGPVPDLGLLDVDFRREQAFVAVNAFDRLSKDGGAIQAVSVPTAFAASRRRDVAICALPSNSTRGSTTGPGSISIVSVLVPLAASAVNVVAIVAWR